MKRFHVHVGVNSLEDSIAFYAALFGVKPTKTKEDYAKWMLDDPFINFSISTRAKDKGVNHLGIQVDEASELEEMRSQLSAANISTHDEGETVCCYARSEKSWVKDPSGVAWETYMSMEDTQLYSEAKDEEPQKASGCCG